MGRIPVFDVGDTFLPSKRMINGAVNDHLDGEVEFPIYDYNIYRPAEVRLFLEQREMEADPEEISRTYLDLLEEFLEDEGVFEMLQRLNEEFGTVGFISDNTLEMKYFWKDMLERQGVEYEGFVVSEEVGVEKPEPGIFEAFTSERPEIPGSFVYFGNNAEKDRAAVSVAMKFVWVTCYDTFDTSYDGASVDRVGFDKIREAIEEVESREHHS